MSFMTQDPYIKYNDIVCLISVRNASPLSAEKLVRGNFELYVYLRVPNENPHTPIIIILKNLCIEMLRRF